MIPSVTAEVFAIPLESDRYLLYAPLRRVAFVANGKTVKFIADLQRGHLEHSADPDGTLLGFLRAQEIVDGAPETPPVTTFTGVPEPASVSLFLTTACNLRCTYCYASAGETPHKAMPLEVAMRGIDFVAANARRRGLPKFEVVYHGGGEPTANWHVMTGSLAYAKEKASELGLEPPQASASSNGVLRDDQIDWMMAHLQGGVSVSFDGLPEVHDKHRLTILGQGSSERVIHTLRRFDRAGFPYGIRVTVTADNIARLPESVEYICSQFAPGRIQVEPSFQMGRWRGSPSAETMDFVAAYREAQAAANRHGQRIYFSAVRTGTLSNHFCGVTQDAFALSPDGNVSACYEVFSEDSRWSDVFFYGRPVVDGAGYSFELKTLDHLRRQGVENRAFCAGCYAKWSCSGDCYHKSVNATGGLEFQGTDRCYVTRELTKDEILANIVAAGGMYWRGAAPGETGAEPVEAREALVG